MNTKEQHIFNKENNPFYETTDKEIVKILVNRLIEALYIPTQRGFIVDDKRLKHFGIKEEPINWAVLRCIEVKKFADDSFLVTIEEANPIGCETFCRYIEEMMESYGWDVKVETGW